MADIIDTGHNVLLIDTLDTMWNVALDIPPGCGQNIREIQLLNPSADKFYRLRAGSLVTSPLIFRLEAMADPPAEVSVSCDVRVPGVLFLETDDTEVASSAVFFITVGG